MADAADGEGGVMDDWSPTFGMWVENTMASELNPCRRGRFVRTIWRRNRVNPGRWWELTDGQGDFWQVRPENCRPAPGGVDA